MNLLISRTSTTEGDSFQGDTIIGIPMFLYVSFGLSFTHLFIHTFNTLLVKKMQLLIIFSTYIQMGNTFPLNLCYLES